MSWEHPPKLSLAAAIAAQSGKTSRAEIIALTLAWVAVLAFGAWRLFW